MPSDHRVEVVPNSGHFVFLEQPQLFNAALLRSMESYLPHGLAAKLIAQEEKDRLAKEQLLQEQLQARQLQEQQTQQEAKRAFSR